MFYKPKKIFIVENFNLPIFKKKIVYLSLQKNKKFGFLKRKGFGMKNKTFINECKCLHCQQKVDQINNSILYWDKLILKKKLT